MNPITTRQAAEILGVSPGRVSQFVTSGRLVPVRSSSRKNLFDRQAVLAFAQVKREPGNPWKRAEDTDSHS